MTPVAHLNPYRDTALKYRESFWLGALPLPYKEKHPPPTDFTGHRAKHPSKEQIREWCNDGKRHNIGIRLAGVDKEHEIIGIDVDHYLKGDKNKEGGDQLKKLEDRLGALPPTWTSSARTDGLSGIRFYRVPRGMAFRGQIDKDIECISKGYRFAVVWPSIHPDGGTYWWFPPGVLPDSDGRKVWSGDLPNAAQLPLLPEPWLDYLTQGKMRGEASDLIDMDSSVDDIYVWADDTFYGDSETDPCDKMTEKLNKHKKLVEDEATSHDKLINAHFNLVRLAAEGHLGWNMAVNELENHFKDITLSREKRTLEEVCGEIFRSRINALRKVKAQVDSRLAIGAAAVDPCCLTTGACGGGAAPDAGPPDDPLFNIPRGVIHPVDSYEMNDTGNAQHFVDKFSSAEIGPSVRWADGVGWMIWHDGDNPHWEVDETGEGRINEMWQRIRKYQKDYIDQALQPDYEQQFQQWGGNGPMPGPLKAAKIKLEKWKKFHEINGNVRNTDNALKAVQRVPGVTITANSLDRNPYLLGVANGVVELDQENVRLRKAVATDYVTLNTKVAWERPSDRATAAWKEYLDTFLPDRDLQRATQVALGHCIIGGNPEKIMIVLKGDPNTGKSTMVTALLTALGDYAESVNHSVFQNHKLNPILADALNKRVIVCSEFEEESTLSASTLKGITGGHDEIRAEKKGSNAKFSGIPQFVPILATNEVPKIPGADQAVRNRLHAIPFNVTPTRIRKEFANVIKATCGVAILGWLIEGYVEYRKIGEIPVHDLMKKETDAFAAELDEVATFAYECLQRKTKPSGYIRPKEMYVRFEAWWRENSFQEREKPSQPFLTRRLKALGWKQSKNIKVNGVNDNWFIDVGWKKETPKVYDITGVVRSMKPEEGTKRGN
jgi:P4 family phage/plasmid primase-like protien